VIFTPQKKANKKRTAATLIASSVEELQAQAQLGGTPVALFPSAAAVSASVPAAEKKEAQEVPAVAVAAAAAVDKVAPAAVFSTAVSSSSSAKVNILVPKSKPKATPAPTVAATAVTPSSGTKRKSDAPVVPKSAKKAATVESVQPAAVTPAPASSVKKITSFLFGTAQSKVDAPVTEGAREVKDVEVVVVDEAQS